MQFKFHINNTNDGTVIAKALRTLASQIDGHRLNHGFTRDNPTGFAMMTIGPQKYESCADAERDLGMTFDWSENDLEHRGSAFGIVHAIVKK